MSNGADVVAPGKRVSLIEKLATKYHVEPAKMLATLKATAFRQSQGEVSNEQMMSLLVVADQYGLNPWTREIYAFPDRNKGIVPVVGIDGFSRILNENPQFDGIEFELGYKKDGALDSCTATIYRKDRSHATRVTEYYDECKRDTGPWNSHPRRMLRWKAMAQAARVAFGYVGVYDEDEAQRIIDAGGGVAVPVSDGSGLEGEHQAGTRTSGLAADLHKRAAGATDAQIIGADTDKMSAGTIRKTIADSEVLDEVNGLLQHIMALPDNPERKELMQAWNKRIGTFKSTRTADEPDGQREPGSDDVPLEFGGKADDKTSKEAKKPTTKAPAEQKPADSPAGFAAIDTKPTDEDMKAIIKAMQGAKTADALDLVADRETKRGWTVQQRQHIYDAYMAARGAFNE